MPDAQPEPGPLHWRDDWFGGAWLATRHADCEALLRDSTRFSARRTGGWVNGPAAERGALSEFQRLFARAMLFVDAPDHGRLRALMQGSFTPIAMQGLRQRIEGFVHTALDEIDARAAAGQGTDFIAHLALPLPARVMAWVLGLADEDPELFSVAASDDLAAFLGAAQPDESQARSAERAMLRLARAFEQVLAPRRLRRDAGAPPADLLDRLLQGEADGRIDSQAELLAQCVMLLFAGHETTRHLLGSLAWSLAQDPAQWHALQAQPALVPRAVREVLRLQPPVRYTGRRAVADVPWGEHTIRRGELVLAMIASANRDPARFPDPHMLDLARQQGASLAFGTGPHVCIGAALTQMEAEITLQQMLARWPERPQLLDAAPDWIPDPLYRGFRRLHLMPALHLQAPASAPVSATPQPA